MAAGNQEEQLEGIEKWRGMKRPRISSSTLFALTIVAATGMGAREAALQAEESRYVRATARRVVATARAVTPEAKVVALRDYLRAHVARPGAKEDEEERPFFRATAAQTLRSRMGFCGEVTRAFICMAADEGIPARRITFTSRLPHVVAEAEIAPGRRVLVDSLPKPPIPGLELLEHVRQRPGFETYTSLNLRRFHLDRLFPADTVGMSPVATYWTENPHALKSLLWFLLAAVVLALRSVVALGRRLRRRPGPVPRRSLSPSAAATGAFTRRPAERAPPDREPVAARQAGPE